MADFLAKGRSLHCAELVELKIACEYIRLYRDSPAFIIAAAQVADALQNAIPFAARFSGTNALSATLDALFIDCPMAWEDIFGGRLDESEIIKRRHRMMNLRHEADLKSLPNGLPVRKQLLKLAKAYAAAHVETIFPK